MKQPMKAVYSNGNIFIVKVSENIYYYGDGEKINAFGQSAVQFLRFNPHLKDVSEQKIEIPDNIKKEINKQLEKNDV